MAKIHAQFVGDKFPGTHNQIDVAITHYSGHGCNRACIAAEPQEDKSKFTEAQVLTGGMREEMGAFYDRIDADLAEDAGKGEW